MAIRSSIFDAVPSDGSTAPNFHRAKVVEAWLESLCTCQPLPSRDSDDTADYGAARVLFILDDDFGELTTVMNFVMGQPCFHDAIVLLSPRLYKSNHDALPGRLWIWTSEEEVTRAIDAFQPKIVVFASGYLLPVHKLLTAEALERLCGHARRKQAVVVTTDPFLGLISQWSIQGLGKLISIDIPENAGPALLEAKKAGDTMLHAELSAAEKVLLEVPHLYPSHCDMDEVATVAVDSRNLGFFNEALLLPLPPFAATTPPGLLDVAPTAEDRPHWMFVISQADYQTQSMFIGGIEFAKVVANLLNQAALLGRHAIFLGPGELIDLVSSRLVANEHIHLLRFCSFRTVMSLLLTAEYGFYWNLVSHSILMQLWNGKPVILFDRGHLARAMPAIYERTIAWYYQGWNPPYLNQNDQLSLAVLEQAITPHSRRRTEIMARFRRAPSPAVVLKSLLRCVSEEAH